MKNIAFKKPSIKQILFVAGITLLVAAGVWMYLDMRRAKEDITKLWIAMEQVPEGSQALYETIDECVDCKDMSNDVSYSIQNQYVQELEVASPDTLYKDVEYITYDKKQVRVVELLITNNQDWTYSSYSSVAKVTDDGQVIRSLSNLKPGQDKNIDMQNGYGLELAPGGKGVMYLYFLDDGNEITSLYDVDMSRNIEL